MVSDGWFFPEDFDQMNLFQAEENHFKYADKYAFHAEWYNEVAEVVKPFLLSFYPHDNTLELVCSQTSN